jgi:hypothetical protein
MGTFDDRQMFRELVKKGDADKYKKATKISKMFLAHLHVTFTSTLSMTNIVKYEKANSSLLVPGSGLKIFAPIVSSLMDDVREYLILELTKNADDRRGAMILSSRSTGSKLISYLLRKLNIEDGELKGKCGHLEVKGLDANDPLTSVNPNKGEIASLQGSKNLQLKTREWNNTVGEGPLQIFMIDTDMIKEGLNVLRIGKVFCTSYFDNYSDMVQTYGRADRRCSPQSLSIPVDDDIHFLELPKIQYLPKVDKKDPICTLVHNKFKQLKEEYEQASQRRSELIKYSL